jgi:hypothetical protein
MLGSPCSPCCSSCGCDVPPTEIYWKFDGSLYSPFGAFNTTPFDYLISNTGNTLHNALYYSAVTLTRSDLVYGSSSFEGQPTTPAISYVLEDTTPRTIFMSLLPRFPRWPQTTPDYAYVEALGAQRYDISGRTYYQYPLMQKRSFFAVHFFYASTRPSLMEPMFYNESSYNCFYVGHYFSATWKPLLESGPEYSATYQSSTSTGFDGQNFITITQPMLKRSPDICFFTIPDFGQLITQTSDYNSCVSIPQSVGGKWYN